MLVLDASLAVELSLDRIGDSASDTLGDEQFVAPPLLWSEVPSVLSEMAFRGDISRELAERALNRFLDDEINISECRPEGLTMMAWQLAAELGKAKTYDAEYLAAARLLGTRVVTLDMRLKRNAAHLGLVVTPTELGAPEAPTDDPSEPAPS